MNKNQHDSNWCDMDDFDDDSDIENVFITPDIVGYVLFNKRLRRFVTDDYHKVFEDIIYTDDLNVAYKTNNIHEALDMLLGIKGKDKDSLEILPLVKNSLFGYSIESGFLD